MTVAYDAFIASHTQAAVVLAEVQPMERLGAWTAAGGGLTNTWYAAYSTQALTAFVSGGIYRRLDAVKQNATALTSRASAALVDANPGSYFHELASNRIYVHTTGSVHPDTVALVGAWFTLFFSTVAVSFSDQPGYWPILTDPLPAFVAEKPDPLFGASVSEDGALTLLNGDGLFDEASRRWDWRNKTVTLKHGGTSLAYSDFATVATSRINSIQVDDDVAILRLETQSGQLSRQLPPRIVSEAFSGEVTEEAAMGMPLPLLFGDMADVPLILIQRNTGVSDVYGAIETSDLSLSEPIFGTIYAIERATGTRTTLVETTDYVAGPLGFITIEVTNSDYFHETHDLRADIVLPNLSGRKLGEAVKRILLLCGERTVNIDEGALAALDNAAVHYVPILSRYVKDPVSALDLIRELEQSRLAQVYITTAGLWSCRILDPSLPSTVTSLVDADFAEWSVQDSGPVEFATVLNEVRVRYSHNPSDDSWQEVSNSDSTTQYANETSDSHRITSWLTTEADARVLAQRTRFLRSTIPAVIEFEERGASLLGASVGDMVRVTRARAPNARTGTYDAHLLQLTAITKDLSGPTVSGTVNDFDGQADRIFRLAPSGSTLAWSTATAEEKALYGFLSDSSFDYLDGNDPVTRHGKVLY